ncbi:MAG: PEP/pyruvate-binding domain-containing protein [Thermodesulfobacteriota bacterium]
MALNWLSRLGLGGKGSARPGARPAGGAPGLTSPVPGLPLAQRYEQFIGLLRANNRALEIMAELQAKIRGDSDLSLEYVQDRVRELNDEVGRIVDCLGAMSPAAAEGLAEVYRELRLRINQILSRTRVIPEAEFVIPFSRLGMDQEDMVGGKAAHLGELTSHLNLPVPPGFAVTTYAFKRFLDHNDLWQRIHELLNRCRLDHQTEVVEACANIGRLIAQGELPPLLAQALEAAYDQATAGRPDRGVAVRSSALMEDTSAGFAGQYETLLNVRRDGLAQAYKRIVVSQFSPQVVAYRHQRGLGLEDMAMGVAVMLMIPAQVSGVLYTCNPNDPEQDAMMVSAVWGLGARAVGGQMPSSLMLVSKSSPWRLIHQEIAPQETMTVATADGGLAESPLPDGLADEPLLSEAQLRQLWEIGQRLEEYYGRPVDVEWAVGPEGGLHLLQARSLRIIAKKIVPADYERIVAGHPVLATGGVTASPGVAVGRVVHVHGRADLAGVTEGCVLVAQSSLPEYALVLDKATGLVCEVGGPASHLASVARERRVPAVFGVPDARRALKQGELVTLDADRALVYAGEIRALVILQAKRFLALVETQAYRVLEKALERITPLNLTDPRKPEFGPAHCRTLHDITRYCHEMAMQEMFRYGESAGEVCYLEGGRLVCDTPGAARRLAADFPLELYLIDLGGGVDPAAAGAEVAEADVRCRPLLGLLKGIHSVEWRGPGAVEAKTLAESLQDHHDPEVRRRIYRHNYVLISREYMNLSSRLGFHFSTVDALCSATDSDNYIRFTFLGGGADPPRRMRRARFIGAVLEKSGYWVDIQGDNVFARLEKYPCAVLEAKLAVIGRLFVMTRQMDMVMFSDAVVDWYVDQFMKGETPPGLTGP